MIEKEMAQALAKVYYKRLKASKEAIKKNDHTKAAIADMCIWTVYDLSDELGIDEDVLSDAFSSEIERNEGTPKQWTTSELIQSELDKIEED